MWIPKSKVMFNKYVMFFGRNHSVHKTRDHQNILSTKIFRKLLTKVSHQRFLHKLKAHGIGHAIIDWIEKWLTDRRQRVVV